MFLLLSAALAQEPHVFMSGRLSAAYPPGYPGADSAFATDLGGVLRDGNALGVRFAWVPDTRAVSSSFTWSVMVPVGACFDVYPTGSFGFMVDRRASDGGNEIRPVLQGGFGARIHGDTRGSLFLAPEMGVIGAPWSPYIALNVGLLVSAGGQ